jgi:catechol 2,3-dioxygenase-like lactoylglutathione lyase family enzyme
VRLHHAAICTSDIDSSLTFWRDGLGLDVLMDHEFEGDWPTLFGSSSSVLRSVFLGERGADDAGVVELVDFGDGSTAPSVPEHPAGGFFLLSFNVDLTETVGRLAELGVGGEPTEVVTHGVRMAVVHSPDGVRVELIDLAAIALPTIEAGSS